MNLLLWRFPYPWQLAVLWPYHWSSGKAFLVQWTSENTAQSRVRHTPLTSQPQYKDVTFLQLEETLLGIRETNLMAGTSLQHPYCVASLCSLPTTAACLFPREQFPQSGLSIYYLSLPLACKIQGGRHPSGSPVGSLVSSLLANKHL